MRTLKQLLKYFWRPLRIKTGVLEMLARRTPIRQLENDIQGKEKLFFSLYKTYVYQRFILKHEKANLYEKRLNELEDEIEILLQTIVKKRRQKLQQIKKQSLDLLLME